MEDVDARSRILKAAIKILEEEKHSDGIKIRRIADEAGVAVGLINYHFKSKENLLSEAVAMSMGDIADKLKGLHGSVGGKPEEKLKKMLMELCKFGAEYYEYLKISVAYEIQHGNMDIGLYLIPVLREIFGDKKDEYELRIIALQLISTLQIAALKPKFFKMYSGIDMFDESQRNKLINIIVENIL